ncbi:MAG: hypothetical protein LBF94_02140 [Puniceicoccales bacterium]|jgi:hypothetical protein|nr:hypothetical protein [Puniceicoccales bacterium]
MAVSPTTYNSQQIAFCRIDVGESFTPKSIQTKWLVQRNKPEGNANVCAFAKTSPEIGFMDMQRADMETNLDVVCYLNGQKIGEAEKFSSLKFGEDLAERTCVVCIYDKNHPNFIALLSQLLASLDLKIFLTISYIKNFLNHCAVKNKYADLANPKIAPHPPTAESSETFSAKKTKTKETVSNATTPLQSSQC